MSWLFPSKEEKISKAFQACVADKSSFAIVDLLREDGSSVAQGLETLSISDPKQLEQLLLIPGVIDRFASEGQRETLHAVISALPHEPFDIPKRLQGNPQSASGLTATMGSWETIMDINAPLPK